MNSNDKFKTILEPYFGKLCRIKNAFTYESGLYFYAFDGEKEKKISDALVDDVIGNRKYWNSILEELNIESSNAVIFGITVSDEEWYDYEDTQEEPELVTKALKKGLSGLIKIASTPGPLFYDRVNGNCYFFPDGSPSSLSEDGTTKRTLEKLKIKALNDQPWFT